ncbi:MAG: hypothetical protein WCF93_05240 [Candidatus Moraniibacteriota bacterium]
MKVSSKIKSIGKMCFFMGLAVSCLSIGFSTNYPVGGSMFALVMFIYGLVGHFRRCRSCNSWDSPVEIFGRGPTCPNCGDYR